MMSSLVRSLAVCLVAFSLAPFASWATLINGDFSAGLTDWTSGGDTSTIGEQAVLGDDAASHSWLYQGLAMTGDVIEISLDLRSLLSDEAPAGFAPDTFLASLYFVDDLGAFDLDGGVFDDALGLFDLDVGGVFNSVGTVSESGLGSEWFLFEATFSNTFNYVIPVFELFSLNGIADDSAVLLDNVALAVPERVCPWPCDGELLVERRPAITWCAVDGATWYQVWIGRNGKTYRNEWLNPTDPTWLLDEDLKCGNYTWYVRSWGPGVGMGPWEGPCDFEVLCCTPEQPVPSAPVDTCEASGPVTYAWPVDDCGTWYQQWVNRNDKFWYKKWYAVSNAVGDTAHVVAGHPYGEYAWWVRGWGPDGFGIWSERVAFAIGQVGPVEPAGIQAGPVTEVVWEDACSADAAWYQIWISRGGTTYWAGWVARAETSDAGGSRRSYALPVPIEIGDYTWWIRAWRPGGSGPWSSGQAFTVP